MLESAAQMQDVRLVAVQEEIVTPREITLTDEIYTIGRISSCNIVVRHPLTSRLHARIERQGPRYMLADAGSANGTYVNGKRIVDGHLLQHDDVIGLGQLAGILRFIDPDSTLRSSSVLQYDERTMQFMLGGGALQLSPMQFRLLRYLYRHAGDICSRESCAQAIWGRDYDPGMDASALDQAISSLRRTLRRASTEANLIETRRDLGYVLNL